MSARGKEKALAIEAVLNDFSFDAKEVAKSMSIYMHRTNQQTFMRLCQEWLKVCASEEYMYDDRNKATHYNAMVLMEGHEDLDGVPFI